MEDLIFQKLLESGTFALITVGLLFYVLKNTAQREQLFFNVLNKQEEVLKEQSNKLSEITSILSSLVSRIEKLENKIDK